MEWLGSVGKLKQVTVIFPSDFVTARLTYHSTPSRLCRVSRKNSSSHYIFEVTNNPWNRRRNLQSS